MQRLVVNQHRWMGSSEFAALFALAQAAPGPNMLVATLVGWRVAGLPGALAATLGMIGPSSLLTWLTAGAWHRFRDRPWRRQVQAGLVPVTVGAVMAGAVLLVVSTSTDVSTSCITLCVTTAVLATQLHPVLLLAGGALAGILFSVV
jgi:chromate transporter